MEEEIDPRVYIDTLIRHWRLVVAIPLVAVVVAAVFSFFMLSPVYEAKAGVVVVKTKSEIAFDPKFLTTSDLVDTTARRKAMETLAKNSTVVRQVLEKVNPMLKPEERTEEALLSMVQIQSVGDLFEFKVSNGTPQRAVAVANAWAEAFEKYINDAYADVPQSSEEVQAQVSKTKKDYEGKQEELARFLGNNRVDELSREVDARQKALSDAYETVRSLDHLLADTRALRDQLHNAGSSVPAGLANTIAVLLVRVQEAVLVTTLPSVQSAQPGLSAQSGAPAQSNLYQLDQPGISQLIQLQLTADSLSATKTDPAQLAVELDGMVARLETRRKEQTAQIAEGKLEQELLRLQEALEREKSKQRELLQARDVAWDTFTTMSRKAAEISVASQWKDTQVRFASPAVAPTLPVGPKKAQNIAIAGALGLVIGVLAAFGLEYLAKPRKD